MARHRLFEAMRTTVGDEEAGTLMELLPPVGWADVATKHDLAQLEARVDLRFDHVDKRFDQLPQVFATKDDLGAVKDDLHAATHELHAAMRSQTWLLVTLIIGVLPVLVAVINLTS